MVWLPNRRLLKGRGGCPSLDELRSLLDSTAPASGHTVRHLDRCLRCRERLERAAGEGDLWSAAARHLGTAQLECEPALADLIDSIRTTIGASSRPERATRADRSLDFLEPCANPGRMGRLDRYEVIEVLGAGGMGIVLKAFDPSLQRMVAIKVLASPLAQNSEARRRFRREARAAAAVRSPHVVAIHAVEDEARLPYLVMEYVPGRSLQDRLDQDDPLPLEDIFHIGAQVALGLAAAHARRLVHRDIKPANILIEGRNGAVKITDFGLARAIDDASLTQAGSVAGTPEYMAPEQAEGSAVDHRADLFSLGSVLYAMCTGRPPFTASNTLAVLRQTREQTPPSLHARRKDVPPWLVGLIETLHKKSPDGRWLDAAAVAEALQGENNEALRARLAAEAGAASRRCSLRLVAVVLLAATVVFALTESTGMTRILAGAATLFDPASRRTTVGPSAQTLPILPENRHGSPESAAVTGESRQLVRRFEGHTGPVNCVAFSPDEKLAASGSGWPAGDRTIRLWDVATGRERRRLETLPLPGLSGAMGPRELPGEIHGVVFSPDGRRLLSCSAGGFVRLWDVATGDLVRQFKGHEASAYAIAMSPDGRLALSGGRDHAIFLWDVASGAPVRQLSGHQGFVRSVAFSPDGRQALSGSLDKTMRLWDVNSGKELRCYQHDAWVWSVAFSSDSRRGFAASGTEVNMWDMETGQLLGRLGPHGETVTGLAVSPDDRLLASVDYGCQVRLWEIPTGREVSRLFGHRGWVWTVAFSPDGSHLLSGGGGRSADGQVVAGDDFALRLWQVRR